MATETPGIVLMSKTGDNKFWVQSTARPMGTFTCFSSEGDAQDNPLKIGGGEKMIIHHQIGDPLDKEIYIDLNVKENRTFLGEGSAFWKSCDFDEICLNVVPKTTPYIAGTNTFFNLYGGFLIVPAAGDGQIQVNPAEIQLIEIPFSIDEPSKRQSMAFWDADYNLQTHQFENLRPNLYGVGQYNIFGVEIALESVVNIIMLGDGCISLRTSDVAEFGCGMRLKLAFKTHAPDHEWKCATNLTLSRQHSC